MNREELAGKKVTVVGLGRSGRAAAQLLLKVGAKVLVSEALPADAMEPNLAVLRERGVELELGGHRLESFLGADLIVVSPGVDPEILPLRAARAEGIPVIGEVELAYRFASATFVGVTGTNGKSTTVSLIGEMLHKADRPVVVAGNIGLPLCEIALSLTPEHIVVTELSSFQLETTETFRCHIGVLLNITPDHLNRHSDMEGYLRAKAMIFERQGESDYAVLNADDELCMSLVGSIRAELLLFSRRSRVERGCYLDQGDIVFRRGGTTTRICPIEEITIKGVHNLENAMAATAVASLLNVQPPLICRSLRDFAGLEHRLELVQERDGIIFVNDSKGTNVGAAIKSLESFHGPIILIAGGRDKKGDFTALAEAARGKVKALILLGEARGKLKQAFLGIAPAWEAADMAEAVRKAYSLARAGDVILLSPACASFDMFANFEERGRAFKEEVRRLPPKE